MKYLPILLCLLLISCGPQYIKVYDGPPGTEEKPEKPIWTVENPPDELTVERTTKERGTEKLVIKQTRSDWNPFTWFSDIVTGTLALVFGSISGVQPSVGR